MPLASVTSGANSAKRLLRNHRSIVLYKCGMMSDECQGQVWWEGEVMGNNSVARGEFSELACSE